MRGMRDETAPQLEALGLSPHDPWLLAELDRHQYPTEVVRITGMPAPTVSQILKRMEGDGLVVRSLDSSDLRRMRFEVTKKGKHLMEQSQKLLLGAMERRLERLDPKQREQFVGFLDILAQESPETIGRK